MISQLLALALAAPAIPVTTKSVNVNGRSVSATVASIDPKLYQAKVVTGTGRIGSLASLESMAQQVGGVAAINGAFFDAYSDNKIRNTVQTLISNRRPINASDIGCVFGMGANGDYRIDRLKIRVRGTVDRQSWYVYRFNNDPVSASVAMEFNSAWGRETGFDGGLQIQVRGDKVTWISRTSTTIPTDGYVLFFKGTEESQGKKFKMGSSVTRTVTIDAPDKSWWANCQEGVGAGPTLVKQGKIVLDAEEEGFTDPKILTASGARSMIGIHKDGNVLLVTSSGTVAQTAVLMKELGCIDAMNLDGGASSGLYANGKAVRKEGRLLTNALVFTRR